jgi:hypothetical protein
VGFAVQDSQVAGCLEHLARGGRNGTPNNSWHFFNFTDNNGIAEL